MSEKEKAIVEKLKDTIPKMSEYQKGICLAWLNQWQIENGQNPTRKNRERSSRWTRKKGIFQKSSVSR